MGTVGDEGDNCLRFFA